MRKKKSGKIRRWLIDLRNEKGLTQGDVADAVGISQPSYCDIENGVTNPKIENAIRIGNLLGFDWKEFFENEKEEKQNE